MRRKLQRKDFLAEDIDAVIDRLTGSGLLNDSAFALQYARTKLTMGSASKRRIRQALAKKGIPVSLADSAVDQVIADEAVDMEAILERVARKKLLTLSGLEKRVIQRRLFGFLARRGYDLDEIRRVMLKLSV
jgi:regulatory protein